MDGDLDHMSREQLVTEVKELRQGIREHQDSTGHDLCWHCPALWSLLPEQSEPLPMVPKLAGVLARVHQASSITRRAGARTAIRLVVCHCGLDGPSG